MAIVGGVLESKTIAVVPGMPNRGIGRKVGGRAGCMGLVGPIAQRNTRHSAVSKREGVIGGEKEGLARERGVCDWA